MLSNKYLKRYLILLGMTLLPVSVLSQDECEEFRKQVSIDGGDTWFDADDAGSAPTQVVGGEVEYRFILRNCTARKVCVDTVINDAELGILDAPVTGESGVGVILPGETVTVTKADDGFGNLDQPDRCDTPGTKLNTAIETTRFDYDGSPIETMTDVAYVNCEEGPKASLGDRVWKDLNGDGIQNCADTNGDGLIGSTLTNPVKDAGAECGAGIDDVLVRLRVNCNDDGSGGSVVGARTTSNGGFYFFDDLLPEQNYCVDFGDAPANVDICTTDDGINLGDALFTSQGQGAGDSDSDADPDSGRSGVVVLANGEVNRDVDAGLVCPVKIGNRVWVDENNDGLQTDGEMNVDGVKVTLLNCDGEPLGPMQETVDGMYMFGGEPCGGINDDGSAQPACLSPGEYIVEFGLPEGYSATTPNVGPDGSDSDCVPSSPGIARTMCTDLTSPGEYNRDRDCGIVPPPEPTCELGLEKSCYVVPAPTSTFDKCDGKLQQFTVIWNGDESIGISGPSNDSDGTVSNGQAVTFTGPFDNNDVVVSLSGAANGSQSTFHMSCSDDDFNDPTDCGKSAGNGKSNDSDLNDDWILEGFVDNSGQVLNCGASDDATFTPNCSFVTPQAPSCETTGKPDNLTWRYDGGSCEASTFAAVQGGDFECIDSGLDTNAFITVMDDKDGATVVAAGDEFTISRDASKEMSLSNAGGTQELVLHTSCSQPLEVGRTAGALTLVAMDGLTGGVDVTYQYVVTNSGDPVTGVLVTDNLLGDIGGPVNLGNGDTEKFTKMARLFGTTTNVGTVSSDQCEPVLSNTVTVEAVTPTCEVSIRLDKVEDKKIKWKISNVSGVDATVDTMSVSWPGSESLKKVKFDGNDILKDVSLPPPSTSIDADEWMKQLKDRRLDAGESGKNLEIEFTGNFPNKKDQSPSDFGLEVTFEEGCSVMYNDVIESDR